MKARVHNRHLLLGVAGILLFVLFSQFQAVFWSRDYARARALYEVTQFCLGSGRDPALLTGFREDTVGNVLWSFEWNYDGKPRLVLLIKTTATLAHALQSFVNKS